MKIKVCGMKNEASIAEVASLLPDFMGFIFWEKSPRHFDGILPELPQSIRKVGVFVDASEAEIFGKIAKYDLDLVQLHGKESVEFVSKFKSNAENEMAKDLKVIKAFSVDENFDFGILKGYEPACDYFLFDTKGKNPGGNGRAFDWQLLQKYSGKKPIFLSGGIAPESARALQELDLPIFAIDINSRFETGPGIKNASAIARFTKELK
jgi:phosphoribosylanthranilate isomerase